MYHNEGFCYGFLIDADGGERSYLDEEVLITRMLVPPSCLIPDIQVQILICLVVDAAPRTLRAI